MARHSGDDTNEIRACDCTSEIAMDETLDERPQESGEPLGTGWRVAAWMAFALALLIAWKVIPAKPADMVHGAMLAMAFLLMLFVGALGVVFGLFGAAASASSGDRRFVVILPAFANAALVLWFVVLIFAP